MSSGVLVPKKTRKKPTSTRLMAPERIFAAEYMSNGFNAAQAASVAWPNMKPVSAGQHGRDVLKRPRVKDYLSRLLHAKLEATGLSAERVLRKLEYVLFLDPLDFFEPGDIDGVYKLKSLDGIPAEARECVTKLKCKSHMDAVTGDVEVYMEVEFMSKDKALEMAMKYQGLLHDTNINQVNIGSDVPKIDFDALCEPPELKTIEGTVVS